MIQILVPLNMTEINKEIQLKYFPQYNTDKRTSF